MTNAAKFSYSIFFQWMWLNFLGWIIGVFSSIFLIFLYSSTGLALALLNFSTSLAFLVGFFVWLPLGLAIGFLQSFQLKQWKIKLSSWIWITTVVWWGISFFFDNDIFYYPTSGPFVVLILFCTLLGAGQAFIIRNVFSKSGLWVLANILGISSLLFLQFHLWFSPYVTTYHEEVAILVFPVIGTFTTAVPTGLLLAKFIHWKADDGVSPITSVAG
jgi:hypothetical protein